MTVFFAILALIAAAVVTFATFINTFAMGISDFSFNYLHKIVDERVAFVVSRWGLFVIGLVFSFFSGTAAFWFFFASIILSLWQFFGNLRQTLPTEDGE